MIRFLLPLLASGTLVLAVPRLQYQAATPGQIRFAAEMNYDDTGPGAKDPASNQIYRTYKTLDEALVAHLNDPDTKLPDHEKERAIGYLNYLSKYGTKDSFNQDFLSLKNRHYNPHTFHDKQVDFTALRSGPLDFSAFQHLPSYQSPFRWQKLKEIWPNPLSIKHYTREPQYDIQEEPEVPYNEFPDNSAENSGLSDISLRPKDLQTLRYPNDDFVGASQLVANPSAPAKVLSSWKPNNLSGPLRLNNQYGPTTTLPQHFNFEEGSLLQGNPQIKDSYPNSKNVLQSGPFDSAKGSLLPSSPTSPTELLLLENSNKPASSLRLEYPNNSKESQLSLGTNNLSGGLLLGDSPESSLQLGTSYNGGLQSLRYPNSKEGSTGLLGNSNEEGPFKLGTSNQGSVQLGTSNGGLLSLRYPNAQGSLLLNNSYEPPRGSLLLVNPKETPSGTGNPDEVLWGPKDSAHRGHYTYWDRNGRLHVQFKEDKRHKVYRLHNRRFTT